ncbi:putative MFS multidrug transporter [Xylariomycetidae sp. FL2044]|nr:putative MFS multidrug transporter [Xylariomycetidae sp. FL2044]
MDHGNHSATTPGPGPGPYEPQGDAIRATRRRGSSNDDEDGEKVIATDPATRSDDRDVEKGSDQPSEEGTLNDPNLVDWEGPDDPENPMNFSTFRKWVITLLFGSLTVWVTFNSSVFSAAVSVTADEFGVDTEVTTLGTSLTVLGFATGPLIWGPMSELYGRRRPLFLGYAVFIIFQVPVAVARNLPTVLVFRFLMGFFGASSLAVIGGALADIWDPVDRAVALSVWCCATTAGPTLGPIVGGFLVDSYLGWRWTAWMSMIPSSFFGLISLVVIPETYAPVILQRRAARRRRETGDPAYRSLLDGQRPTAHDIVVKYLFRPFQMLAMEPILVAITVYISLIYGILYLFFTAYPISFHRVRGWRSDGVAALPFAAIMVGATLGSVFIGWTTNRHYSRKLQEGRAAPEDRLPPMMVGALLLPAGLFWFAWTSDPGIPWAPQVVAGVPIGAGILIIWMQGINYLIDVYLMFANSAISANTLIRSTIGFAFPLFSAAMYERLGVAWATSLLGFLGVAMIPIPIIFYFYGPRIRALSRYTPKL